MTRADSPFKYEIPGKLNVKEDFTLTLEITAVEEVAGEPHVSFRWDVGNEVKTFPEVGIFIQLPISLF